MTRLSLALCTALAASLAACAKPQASSESSSANPEPAASEGPVTRPEGSTGSEPVPEPVATAIVPEEPDDTCGASKIAPWIGKEATVSVRVEVVRATGAKGDRWLYPDSPATMDYSPTRLNVIMEKGTDEIVSARCG